MSEPVQGSAPKTWFVADSHFGHGRIIELAGRPFRNIAEHNEALIRAWNGVVAPGDVIWHCGDFGFGDPERIDATFARFEGTKHLIAGNHDGPAVLTLPWASVSTIAETIVDGQRITMCHWPLRTWPGARKGAIHVYGHLHGRLRGNRQSLDVGVDCWDFWPVTLADIRRRLRTLPPDPDFESPGGARR